MNIPCPVPPPRVRLLPQPGLYPLMVSLLLHPPLVQAQLPSHQTQLLLPPHLLAHPQSRNEIKIFKAGQRLPFTEGGVAEAMWN